MELNMIKSCFAVVVGLSCIGLGGCGGAPEQRSLLIIEGAKTQDLDGNTTLEFVPTGSIDSALSAPASPSATRTVSVFYPKPGQTQDGLCWEGLTSDGAGNLYPIANAGWSKLDRNANIINGDNDENFFATEDNSSWGVLDEPVRKLFTASLNAVRSAPFRARAVFTDLISGIKGQGGAVAVGRGPLAGSIFVTDSGASRVYRVRLDPLSIRVFASGSIFKVPEAIASAPDGTLYVINIGSISDPAGRTLVKISTQGQASVFATARDTTARRMLAVDSEGTVFWSSAHGIDRFKPDGTRLRPLSGPNDQPAFENPMGAAFDPQDNLYVVENFGCKKIYKYTEH
jgi:DNA-binding beta-propeller fold protein YncE